MNWQFLETGEGIKDETNLQRSAQAEDWVIFLFPSLSAMTSSALVLLLITVHPG